MFRPLTNNYWKLKVSRSFNSATKSYNLTATVQKKAVDLLVQRIQQCVTSPISSIVDFGAGTGFLTQKIASKFPASRLLAVDIAKGMTDHLQSSLGNNPNISVLCADMENFRGDSFDLITSSFSLHWACNLQNTLSSWNTLLSSGGFLAIAVPVKGSLHPLFSLDILSENDSVFSSYEDLLSSIPPLSILHAECIDVKELFSSPLHAIRSLKACGGAVSSRKPSHQHMHTLLRLRAWNGVVFEVPWKIACIIAQKKEIS